MFRSLRQCEAIGGNRGFRWQGGCAMINAFGPSSIEIMVGQFSTSPLRRAAPDPRLRRSVVSRILRLLAGLPQGGGSANPARAGELIRICVTNALLEDFIRTANRF